jgi:hypothetical protein
MSGDEGDAGADVREHAPAMISDVTGVAPCILKLAKKNDPPVEFCQFFIYFIYCFFKMRTMRAELFN